LTRRPYRVGTISLIDPPSCPPAIILARTKGSNLKYLLHWLVSEDRWKWLRELRKRRPHDSRRSRTYVTTQDLAEPSVRGGDWKDGDDDD
jgi:hypothetical protein